LSGTIKKKDLKVSFEYENDMDEDATSRFIWGKMSGDGKKIVGCWGWEPNETEDTFRLVLVEEPEDQSVEEVEDSVTPENFLPVIGKRGTPESL